MSSGHYTITFVRSAEKDIDKLPASIVRRISPFIDKLTNNPRPNGSKKLTGQKENLWRIRVGNYRIIYLIEDTIKIIEIRRIGHRGDVYTK